MKIIHIILTILITPFVIYGQLKVESIYPSDQYTSGWLTLVLSGDDSIPETGYTSFQIISSDGDTITKKTGTDYELPKSYKITYQLELKEGMQYLDDNFCGSLMLEYPDMEIEFCLSNQRQSGTVSGESCSEFEIVDVIKSGEYGKNGVTVLMTTNDPDGTMPSGYTSFQLFDHNGDSLMHKTGPNYFTPIYYTDTIAYTFVLNEDITLEPRQLDSMCFDLVLDNPDCLVKSCITSSTTHVQDESSLRIFPNPVRDVLHVVGKSSNETVVKLYDLSGKKIAWQVGTNETLDMSSIAAGVYILELQSSEERIVTRLVKM